MLVFKKPSHVGEISTIDLQCMRLRSTENISKQTNGRQLTVFDEGERYHALFRAATSCSSSHQLEKVRSIELMNSTPIQFKSRCRKEQFLAAKGQEPIQKCQPSRKSISPKVVKEPFFPNPSLKTNIFDAFCINLKDAAAVFTHF